MSVQPNFAHGTHVIRHVLVLSSNRIAARRRALEWITKGGKLISRPVH